MEYNKHNNYKRIQKMENDDFNLSGIDNIGRLPLSEQVYNILRKAIIDGILKPDTKLNEVKIAERLEVSATPVREAFRKLAVDGLVVIIPWKGVRVKGYNQDEIVDMYQLREVVEGLGARLATKLMDESTKSELRDLYDSANKSSDAQEVVELNSLFHLIIIEASKNERVKLFLQECKEMINRDMYLSSYDNVRMRACQCEHFDILEAICKGDEYAAEEAMRKHIRNAFAYKKKRANIQ